MTNPQNPSPYDAGYHQNYSMPQPTPMGPPPLEPGKFDAVRSLEQSWRIFAEKPVGWIVSTAIYLGIYFLIFFSGYIALVATMALNTDEETGEFVGGVPWGLITTFGALMVVALIALVLWELVTRREAVYAVSGKRPEIKDFFTYRRCGVMFLMLIVVGLLTTVGMLGLIIGMFVVAFFLYFAMPAIVFEDMGIGDALKSSYNVVKNNLGQSLLLCLLVIVINGIGGSFVFGVLLTGPLCYLAVSHAYMVATGRPVQERMPR